MTATATERAEAAAARVVEPFATVQALALLNAQQCAQAVETAASGVLGPDGLVEAAAPEQLAFLAALAAREVAVHVARGAALGDEAMAAMVSHATGRLRPPVGITRADGDTDRLCAAASTALDHGAALRVGLDEAGEVVDTGERVRAQRALLTRIARAEPLDALHLALDAGLLGQIDLGAPVAGWVRVLDADPCGQCRHWADGRWRPASVVMKRHRECGCTKRPLTLEEIDREQLDHDPRREPRYSRAERSRVERAERADDGDTDDGAAAG